MMLHFAVLSAMTTKTPPPTAFALLALLSLQPWTTYELARQSERSLRWFFPRAERAVYQEAKRLVALGWAEAGDEWTGRRKSTRYRITGSGRRVLRDWLAEDSPPLQVESEGLLKLFFSEQAGTSSMRAGVQAMRRDAVAGLGTLGEQAASWEAGRRPFPDRAATNAVSMSLVAELQRTVVRWADWAQDALDRVEAGPDSAAEFAEEFYSNLAAEAPTPPR